MSLGGMAPIFSMEVWGQIMALLVCIRNLKIVKVNITWADPHLLRSIKARDY